MRIRQIEKNIRRIIQRHLESTEDYVEQFSEYLTWGVQIKYLTELRVGWELQGFKDEQSPYKLLEISWKLAKQEFDETTKLTRRIRVGIWKETLEKAGGDERKALKLYCSNWQPTYKYCKQTQKE